MKRRHIGVASTIALIAATPLLMPAHFGAAQAHAAQTRMHSESARTAQGQAAMAPADTPTPVQPHYTVLRDGSGAPTLAIILPDPSAAGNSGSGTFDLNVGDGGVYEGLVTINPSGTHVDHLHGTVPAQYFPANGGTRVASSVRFEGIVDPTDLSANINIWVGGTHYHLQTAAAKASDASKVAAQVLALFQARDWGDLYPLLTDAMRHTYTQQQFVQTMTAQQGQAPQVVGSALAGNGTIAASPLGFTYYQQPYTERQQAADGSVTTIPLNLYLVLEPGGWHFWQADPSPALKAKLQALQAQNPAPQP